MPIIELTETGIARENFTQIRDGIETELRETLENPLLDAHSATSFAGNLNNTISSRLDLVCQVVEALANALDPDRADGQRFIAAAKLNGIRRNPATQGTATLQCSFSAAPPGGSITAGTLEVYPDGQDENVWTNTNNFEINSDGTFEIHWTSEQFGSGATLPVGVPLVVGAGPEELTEVQLASAEDMTAGQDQETIAAFRARRRVSTQALGDATYGALVAALRAHHGIRSAHVYESPGEIEIVVWDDNEVADNDIAQLIFEHKAPGAVTVGDDSGTATDESGQEHVVYFSRPLEIPIRVFATVRGTPSLQDVLDSIQEYTDELQGGQSVDATAVLCAIRDVRGTRGVTAFRVTKLDEAPAAGELDMRSVTINPRQIATLDAGDVTISTE